MLDVNDCGKARRIGTYISPSPGGTQNTTTYMSVDVGKNGDQVELQNHS